MRKDFIYNANVESLAAKARVANTNEELALICRQLNIADNIFLGEVDLWLAKHALSAAYRTLKKFPALRNAMHYFGTLNGFIKNKEALFTEVNNNCDFYIMNLMRQATDSLAASCRTQFENNGLATAFFTGAGTSFLSGIIINGKSLNQQTILKNLEYGEKAGHSPKGCNSIKSIIEHEIGHLLDYQLGISSCREFKRMLKQYDVQYLYDNLSHYCVMNNIISEREVVAEAYSEYCNNPSPREIAMMVGTLIEKCYKDSYGG